MNFLINKTVFILSPVKWGKMKVSKHHYAIEIALAGNRVYYFEPPDIDLKGGIRIKELEGHKNIFLVSYKPIVRGKKYLPSFIYYSLLKYQISRLIKKINLKPDLVLSFEPYRFENLKWFKAKKTIFFAADLYLKTATPGEVKTADLCLGVSPTIVSLLKQSNPNVHFINHGLNTAFADLAKIKLTQHTKNINECFKKNISVGYFGNLLIDSLDRKTTMDVILNNPLAQFIFWGQFERGQDNIIAFETKEVWEFINFLKQCKNVSLVGPKTHNELVLEIEKIDLFWVCYDINANWQFDGSNSHKILEYLATGKPVIANYTSAYADTDLIYMLNQKDNSKYCYLFEEIVQLVRSGESEKLIRTRLNFALSNTYRKQIEFIDSILKCL